MDYVFMIWEWETTWVGLDLIHVSSTYWSMYANLYTNFDDELDFELSASQDFQNICHLFTHKTFQTCMTFLRQCNKRD